MINFPPQIIILISYFIQPFPQVLHLHRQSIPHTMQPTFLLLILTDLLLNLVDLLHLNFKNTFWIELLCWEWCYLKAV